LHIHLHIHDQFWPGSRRGRHCQAVPSQRCVGRLKMAAQTELSRLFSIISFVLGAPRRCSRPNLSRCIASREQSSKGAFVEPQMTARTVISPSVSAPSCSQCATRMLLVRISPDRPGYERRTYECPWCPREMTEVFCVNELAARLMAPDGLPE
jgi:hypothetical protein